MRSLMQRCFSLALVLALLSFTNYCGFAEQLEKHTICDKSDVKCYDTCGEITFTNSTVECPSKLWYHHPSDDGMTRLWKEVNRVKCTQGTWQAEWSGGLVWVNSDVRLKCSPDQPSKVTGMMKWTLGLVIGGIVVLIIGSVGAFFFVRWWRRRHQKKPSKEILGVKCSTLRDEWAWPENNKNSNKETTKDSNRTPDSARPTAEKSPAPDSARPIAAKTDFDGIKTEVLDQETTAPLYVSGNTNIDALHTERRIESNGTTSPRLIAY